MLSPLTHFRCHFTWRPADKRQRAQSDRLTECRWQSRRPLHPGSERRLLRTDVTGRWQAANGCGFHGAQRGSRDRIARLHQDDSVDGTGTFNANAIASIRKLLGHSDGKLILTASSTTLFSALGQTYLPLGVMQRISGSWRFEGFLPR